MKLRFAGQLRFFQGLGFQGVRNFRSCPTPTSLHSRLSTFRVILDCSREFANGFTVQGSIRIVAWDKKKTNIGA